MLSDDVFRDRLEQALIELEVWANATRDCSSIDVKATPNYWGISVLPFARGACRFDLLLKGDQTFSLEIADEIYEDKPIDSFEFFLKLVNAIEAGHVERIETLSALTGAPLSIESRVFLDDGWAWVGERRVGPRSSRLADTAHERRVQSFLPYRR